MTGGAIASTPGCTPFDADTAPVADGGAPDVLVHADAGEFTTSECTDLSRGASAANFTTSNDGALGVDGKNGLELSFPPDVRAGVTWRRQIDAGSTTGMSLRLDVTINLSQDRAAGWYATIGGISHGNASAEATASFLQLVVAGAPNRPKASLALNTFLDGLASRVAPLSTTFGSVTAGALEAAVLLDVDWSEIAGANGTVTLGGSAPVTIATPTMRGGQAPTWTLELGGYASSAPAMTITYHRVCIRLR